MFKRFRSLRLSPEIRDNHANVFLHTRDIIYPYFLLSGDSRIEEVEHLPGVKRFSLDRLLQDLEETTALGIDKIWLKGIVEEREKSKDARAAFKHNNIIEQAVKAIKDSFPALTVITDVEISAYTSHGQAGILRGLTIDNDKTNEILAKMAESHARAGADFVAPSAMTDGQVYAIRTHLNKRGYKDVKILSFGAKFASSFFGPAKNIDGIDTLSSNRKQYLIDYRTKEQGLSELAADIEEGADWLGVAPAQPYLDVISGARNAHGYSPVVAYQSSGEYLSIVLLSNHKLIDKTTAVIEALTAIKRSGASYVISYFGKEVAHYLNGDPYFVI